MSQGRRWGYADSVLPLGPGSNPPTMLVELALVVSSTVVLQRYQSLKSSALGPHLIREHYTPNSILTAFGGSSLMSPESVDSLVEVDPLHLHSRQYSASSILSLFMAPCLNQILGKLGIGEIIGNKPEMVLGRKHVSQNS
eukprot:Gb_06738 [translate_table: standard]